MYNPIYSADCAIDPMDGIDVTTVGDLVRVDIEEAGEVSTVYLTRKTARAVRRGLKQAISELEA